MLKTSYNDGTFVRGEMQWFSMDTAKVHTKEPLGGWYCTSVNKKGATLCFTPNDSYGDGENQLQIIISVADVVKELKKHGFKVSK